MLLSRPSASDELKPQLAADERRGTLPLAFRIQSTRAPLVCMCSASAALVMLLGEALLEAD
jgi:hypothetical protein